MVDQEGITTLTRHVRNFSHALKELRDCFLLDEDYGSAEDVRGLAHTKLGEVVSILKGVIQRYRTLNPTEILASAGNVIKKVKEHNYSSLDEPVGFFGATDQLALAFSNSVSDYLEEDLSQRTGHTHSDITTIDNLQNAAGYDDFDEKRNFSEMGGEFSEFYEDRSERAESEESLEKSEFDADKRLSLNLETRVVNESDHDRAAKPEARAEELDKALLSIEGSVDISLQRTKVWSKYAKDIISYMERRLHIEVEYCKQLSKLAQTTKTVIIEESYLPFQSTYITALEHDISFGKRYQERLQHELRGKIIEKLTQRRNEHDRIRSKLKERWNKECKKLNESIMNLNKSKSLYVQKQQELKKFVDKQEKGEGSQSSSVVPSFSIGKKKKEEDIAKRAEEAEDYYRKCVDEANLRQQEKEKTRESILLELRELVYQCDMTMRAVTCDYFQMMEQSVAHLPQHYSALAKDNKQSEIGRQFAEYIKLQQTTSRKATPKRFSFELYVADDRTNSDKGYIGPADFLSAGLPDIDQKDSPRPKQKSRRVSTASVGSDTSLNRPSSPIPTKKRQNAWGAPNRYSNSDDTASVSSRSLPGSPSGSPNLGRKETSQRLSLSNTDMDVREEFKKELAGPFRKLKMSKPAQTHTFKKLRSSSKCKKCDTYVYFNGAECELCGLACHKKCLETLAIKCGKSRLPRKMTTFGVDFQKHLKATKRDKIPIIMEKCITEIDLRCLEFRGIYRVSGVKTKVEALSQQFETAGREVDLQSTHPHLITSVLKLYLRELPEPLMTFDLYPEFIEIAKDSTGLKFDIPEDGEAEHNEENDRKCEELLRRLHECVLRLPAANYYTVVRLLNHLRRVANNEEFNQMNCSNLAIIFGPTLLKPRGSASSLSALMDMTHQVRAIELLLMNPKLLDNDHFESGGNIDEEKEVPLIENADEFKETAKRSSSAQSEQDLGYNTQPDQLDDGKPELSLSDELQLDYPDIFKRSNYSGKDLASSFGSLDSVPDMSPDIDEELKDLVLGNPIPDRPKSFGFEVQDQMLSPQNLRCGSDSNLSFDSLSPIEIPDSSMDFEVDLAKSQSTETGVLMVSEGGSCLKEPDSSNRIRRKGHVTLDFNRAASSHTNDRDREEAKDSVDISAGREQLDREITNASLPSQEVEKKDARNTVVINEEQGNQEGHMSAHDGSVDRITNHEFTTQDIPRQEDAGQGNSNLEESGNGSCRTSTGDDTLNDNSTDNVVLTALHCEEVVEQNYEKEVEKTVICKNFVEIQDTQMKKQLTIGSPTSIKVTSSSRINREVPGAKSDISIKKPPRVAPKPTSPTHSSDCSSDFGTESTDETQTLSFANRDDNKESESDLPLQISGNTRKLRDRFIAEGASKDGKQGRTDGVPVKDSSVKPSIVERPKKARLNRSLSSTAKLVEKFTKEVEKQVDTREDSPRARSGVSVKEMLKQFESGDEMDDDETQKPRKKSGNEHEKISQSSNSTGDNGTASLPREQKQCDVNSKNDDKIRSVCDLGNRREPKFV